MTVGGIKLCSETFSGLHTVKVQTFLDEFLK